MPGASDERVDSLVPAALIMDRILEKAAPVDVVFSASGIREGYLYEKLSPFMRNEDPLIASCTDLALQNGRLSGFARELFAWMSPLFERESDAHRRLRFSACILGEIAWRIHPEYRSEWAFFRILQSALAGLSHPERVTLALALYHRYQFKLKLKSPVLDLVKEKDRVFSRLVGTASYLAFMLSGGQAGNLRHVILSHKKGNIEVDFTAEAQDLLSDSVRKRINGLNEVFEIFNRLAT
jgi:exopolyphosphatase/guanosine-5'-triphosphate,3'-diphosphate pyrophosphatase